MILDTIVIFVHVPFKKNQNTYQSVCAYVFRVRKSNKINKTDPLNADSDEDGIDDSDWNERREYTYSIKVVVELRWPFDLDFMNETRIGNFWHMIDGRWVDLEY